MARNKMTCEKQWRNIWRKNIEKVEKFRIKKWKNLILSVLIASAVKYLWCTLYTLYTWRDKYRNRKMSKGEKVVCAEAGNGITFFYVVFLLFFTCVMGVLMSIFFQALSCLSRSTIMSMYSCSNVLQYLVSLCTLLLCNAIQFFELANYPTVWPTHPYKHDIIFLRCFL